MAINKTISQSHQNFFFEDVDLLYNNYPIPPPKGIKQISVVSLFETDAINTLSGKFTTTRTRQYGRQVTGTVTLKRKNDYSKEKLIKSLSDLGLTNTLSFVTNKNEELATIKALQAQPDIANKKVEKRKATLLVLVNEKVKPINQLDELKNRKVETIETVWFSSDSLTLELYDNGFVDGDSISLIVNGKVLLEHQRLSELAISKTISASDSLNIIMYAENLGSIAPNSGLMILRDGDKRHEVRFSGDLRNNASIIMKRKKY